MPRPCACDKPGCRLCHLYHHDPRYRALWDQATPTTQQPGREPGLLQKTATFAGAVVRHVATGARKLSAEQKEARLAVCRGCEQYNAARGSCRLCGCSLSVKAGWIEQACPHPSGDKWRAVPVTDPAPLPAAEEPLRSSASLPAVPDSSGDKP